MSSISASLKITEDDAIWEGPAEKKMGFCILGEKQIEKKST